MSILGSNTSKNCDYEQLILDIFNNNIDINIKIADGISLKREKGQGNFRIEYFVGLNTTKSYQVVIKKIGDGLHIVTNAGVDDSVSIYNSKNTLIDLQKDLYDLHGKVIPNHYTLPPDFPIDFAERVSGVL